MTWTVRQRADILTRDIDRLNGERVAVLHRLEIDLHEEIAGLEAVYAARCAQQKDRDELAVLTDTITEQRAALRLLIPAQPPPQ